MKHESNSPEPTDADSDSRAATPTPNTFPHPAVRADGWTGEKMAIFCEALAETAVVAEACEQARMGISGAYAARRRNPFFAAAWDAALTIARERLADTLLARSMEGNIEQIWRDGELVGERHVLDNRLGLAILRRLDRLAETGATVSSRGERALTPVRAELKRAGCPGDSRALQGRGASALRSQPFDWEKMVNALHTGDPDDVADALALLKSNEVEEVEDPPVSLTPGDDHADDEGLDLSDRCWKDGIDDIWLTSFPPPAGFTGYQSRDYTAAEEYERACTPEEVAILEADEAVDAAAALAEDEALRDAWFECLKSELDSDPHRHPGNEEPPLPSREG